MRLIDADACTKLFDKDFKETMRLIRQGETHLDNLAEGFAEAHIVIRSMPSVDAVKIVRCKDCKHWLKDVPGCTDFVGRCELANYMIGAVGYCVYGERKIGNAAD